MTRTAVVTGASRGIGEAVAAELLRQGLDVVCLQRGGIPERLRQLATDLGRTVEHVPAELAEEESLERAISAVEGIARVDVLVNCAGIQVRHDAINFPLADFDRVIAVNARAALQLAQGFGAGMLARGWGRIVFIASLLSFQGGIRVPAYAVAKGAVARLTQALANEWAPRGVCVNAVAPGYVVTDMNEALLSDPERRAQLDARIPAGRWALPDDIAGPVAFLCSDAARYIHGVVLPVDGGWLGR